MTTTLFSSFVILCLLGVPIAFVLGLSSVFAFIYHGDYPFTLVVQRMFTALDGFSLMAIPFFIFAGGIMDIGGISCFSGFFRLTIFICIITTFEYIIPLYIRF